MNHRTELITNALNYLPVRQDTYSHHPHTFFILKLSSTRIVEHTSTPVKTN